MSSGRDHKSIRNAGFIVALLMTSRKGLTDEFTEEVKITAREIFEYGSTIRGQKDINSMNLIAEEIRAYLKTA